MMKMVLGIGLSAAILYLFFSLGKMEKWEKESFSSFECGFLAYFYSRFSFSVHYFKVGLIFLFLDLELCFVMPFFNGETSSEMLKSLMTAVLMLLLLGLMQEWKKGELEWKF